MNKWRRKGKLPVRPQQKRYGQPATAIKTSARIVLRQSDLHPPR